MGERKAPHAVGLTRRIWLLVAREGGRWTAGEISEALAYDRATVAGNCDSMARAGSLRKFDKTGPGSRVSFGVTEDCCTVHGITMKELAECGLIRVEAEA